ncbi:uncharacterized protein PV07_08783 [Cladophialophora immunda]|uniref:Uncharacterized protein n=1 Tax=Cladophialophora immunda TaxID=569365 RepID=A0A0D2AKV9_9EURO|nr:uncharacterized protein PV07_08783 [Cladophialophora immunda]KIW25617.1 hypothetical protein PV07_08783 [Cladophialophora immunda]
MGGNNTPISGNTWQTIQIRKSVVPQHQILNVPGPPAKRAEREANGFAILHLQRAFTYEAGLIHLPSDFDGDERRTVWILCDFNVRNPVAM